MQMNAQLKMKMETIQDEVNSFSKNINAFTTICDSQLEQLLSNIDKVTHTLKEARDKQTFH